MKKKISVTVSWSDYLDDPLDAVSLIVNSCEAGYPMEPRGTVKELLNAAKLEAILVQDFECAAAIRDVMDKYCKTKG